ncbi:MAG TPA: hypothetical protein EYM86_06785 [Flavobacteriales bacterium]|nr:hypothetical protein [Flavobacteriales bacterium]
MMKRKVVITYSKPTERMRYSAEILFEICLGVDVEWNEDGGTDKHVFIISSDTKEIICPLHSLSLGDDKIARSSGVSWVEWRGYRFPGEVLGVTDLMFDPLASVFFCCSRWEEFTSHGDVNTFNRDSHGRFKGMASAAFVEGMLRTPLIENLAWAIADTLEVEPNTKPQDYEFQPTIDIDIAYAYLGRDAIHSVAAGVRDFIMIRWGNLFKRIQVLIKGVGDPYDSYDYFLTLHEDQNLISRCFIHYAEYNRPYDLGVSKSYLDSLISSIESRAKVCWHPSYAATENRGEIFRNEKDSFALKGSVEEVRTHFLRGQSSIWREFQDNFILHDYSMGYADQPGFRAGMSRPFPAFDLENNEPMALIIHPFAVMDSTLKSYLGLDAENSVKIVGEMSDAVRQVGGVMVTVWHNTSVSDHGVWKGWQSVYEDVVHRCLP